MSIFKYKCPKCGYIGVKLITYTDGYQITCNQCGFCGYFYTKGRKNRFNRALHILLRTDILEENYKNE